jgi:hypothetical protein
MRLSHSAGLLYLITLCSILFPKRNFHENFRENAKTKILVSTLLATEFGDICSFYPPKICYVKKMTPHAVSLSNFVIFFVFSKIVAKISRTFSDTRHDISWNVTKLSSLSYGSRIFAKIEKCNLVSTLICSWLDSAWKAGTVNEQLTNCITKKQKR